MLPLADVLVASGISAKGGEGGVGDEAKRSEVLGSPTPTDVLASTAAATPCSSQTRGSLLIDGNSESSSAIAKHQSVSLSMLSTASAIESIAAAIESRNSL